MPNGRKASTTARGLGWKHQQQVAALFRKLTDGALCWWCGRPMFRENSRNWDGRRLQGDHTVTRAAGGRITDRLLHATCNEQRGDGNKDHLRPTLTGVPMGEPIPAAGLGRLVMPWP